MKGFEAIAMLCDHYRKYKGSGNRTLVYVIQGKPERYRPATVKPDGKVTCVVLVKA